MNKEKALTKKETLKEPLMNNNMVTNKNAKNNS